MKNAKFVFLNFLFLCSFSLFGQFYEYECGQPLPSGPTNQDPPSSNSPCLNVGEILEEIINGDNCRLIHLNVNVIFFLKNDCSGPYLVHPPDLKPENAYQTAETLINDANNLLASNPITMNGPNVKICNPFRYVLKGVYFHCNEEKHLDQVLFGGLKGTHGINKNSELNIFIIKRLTGADGIGEDFGKSASSVGVYLIDPGNLNHEMGHILNLYHTFQDDECTDTPDPKINIDYNCDGVISNPPISGTRAKEVNVQCGQLVPAYNPNIPLNLETDHIGTIMRTDHAYLLKNDIHDCIENTCNVHPCCNPLNVHNNVMGYNTPKSSFSLQQIERMLNDINIYKCDFINSISTDRSCLPPSAFISEQIPGTYNENSCNLCFNLEASFNEEKYIVEVYEIISQTETLVYSSGWINDQANKI